MPYTLRWLAAEKVVFQVVSGNFTVAELVASDADLVACLDQSTAPLVHMLVDLSGLSSVPLVGAFKDIPSLKHPRMGWYICFGISNKMLQSILYLVGQVFKVRYRFFNTPEEALDFLQKVDSTLPDLQVVWADYQAQSK
jgi:hypothetical protein